MSSYVMSCYVISGHVISCHIILCLGDELGASNDSDSENKQNLMSYHVISCYVISCYVISSHVIPLYCIALYCIVLDVCGCLGDELGDDSDGKNKQNLMTSLSSPIAQRIYSWLTISLISADLCDCALGSRHSF